MIELRPFQKRGMLSIRELFNSGKRRVICCAPTGSGKTFTACGMSRSALERSRTICILVHRIELLEQFFKSLSRFGITPEIISADSKWITEGNIYLGMVETFHRRLDKYNFLKDIDLLICDEAHTAAYFKTIERFQDEFFIGLTATPISSTQARPLKEYYEDIVELAQVEQLIKERYLVDARTYSVKSDTSKLKKKGKDFSEESQLEFFHSPKVYEGDLENYRKYADGRKFIIYAVNTDHSRECARKFTEAGYPCEHLDGNTPKSERNSILSRLRKGELKGISNFGIVTAGFDEDSIECIIQNFATTELSKHIQTAGRGSRPREGKHDFTIIDMGANYARHGLWNRNRDWVDIFMNPSARDQRDRRKAEQRENFMCDECGFVLSVADERCPCCNSSVTEQLKAEANEAGPTRLKEIREELKSRLPERLRKRPSNMSKQELFEYADIMGYSKKWAGKQLSLRKEYFQRRFTR